MTTSEQAPTASASKGRIAAAVILIVIAVLGIVLAATSIWVHQTVFGTDRYVSVVADVAEDPEVVEAVSERLANQLVVALGVQSEIESVLPDRAGFLAGPLTERIEAATADVIGRALASETFQDAWVAANAAAHRRAVAILRDETPILEIDDGVVSLDLVTLLDAGLTRLQDEGVISRDVDLPDLSTENRDAARERLESTFGITLPAGFATIELAEVQSLETAQTAVRVFDISIIAILILVPLVCIVAVLVAPRRLLAIAAIGAASAGLLSAVILVAKLGAEATADAAARPEGRVVVAALADRLADDFIWWAGIVVIAALVAGTVAYLLDRPAWAGSSAAARDSLPWLAVTAAGVGLAWAIAGPVGAAIAWSIVLLAAVIVVARRPGRPVVETA
jgi:hypothetical protein